MTPQRVERVGRGIGELEKEIHGRCPLCARGMTPRVRRDPSGAIQWIHSTDREDGDAVSCSAAGLQPWREIALRASAHVDEIGQDLGFQAELDRLTN